MADSFVIAGRTFRSRLVVGTGKYPSHSVMQAAHLASGTDMVTVAVRRIDLGARGEGRDPSLAPGLRSRMIQLDQTRGHRRSADAVPRQRGLACRHTRAGQGR